MSGTELGASEFLGKRATRAVYAIEDPVVRERVIRAILVCDDALEVVDALDLTPHELALDDGPDLATWNALAPDVRNILVAARDAGTKLLELFPAPAQEVRHTATLDIDIEHAFDEMASGSAPDPIRDKRDHEIDAIVGTVSGAVDEKAVGGAIATLAGMLQDDFANFGLRLRSPQLVADRWALLGELQEMRSKCAQCLEAVVATILEAFTHEELEQVLPRYLSGTRRAQRLRTALVDLEHDVLLLNEQAQVGQAGDLSAIRQALLLRLHEFAELPVYAMVRPLDKRAIIQFRLELERTEPAPATVLPLRRAIEGFSKFLEVIRSINERDVLLRTDFGHLQTIRMLLESEEGVDAVRPLLREVYGRDPSLDVFVRAAEGDQGVDEAALLAAVIRCDERLRMRLEGMG